MLLYHVEKCGWYSYYHLSTMHMTAPYVLKLMTAICLDHVEGRITVIAFGGIHHCSILIYHETMGKNRTEDRCTM
jgi:hypothetical protein